MEMFHHGPIYFNVWVQRGRCNHPRSSTVEPGKGRGAVALKDDRVLQRIPENGSIRVMVRRLLELLLVPQEAFTTVVLTGLQIHSLKFDSKYLANHAELKPKLVGLHAVRPYPHRECPLVATVSQMRIDAVLVTKLKVLYYLLVCTEICVPARCEGRATKTPIVRALRWCLDPFLIGLVGNVGFHITA